MAKDRWSWIVRERPSIQLLVTDVDNTLYDWVAMWYASFSVLLKSVVEISGLPQSVLENEVRSIHQRVGTSEYSFLLQDMTILAEVHHTTNYLPLYQPAIDSFRAAREEAMQLYPGVADTLGALKAKGVGIVAYTESGAYYTALRFRNLHLDGLIDALYSPQDHAIPASADLSAIRQYPDEFYELQFTKHRHTPPGHFKPEPDVLSSIVSDYGLDVSSVCYVGDSLLKDVAMAQSLSVHDAFAAYGVAQSQEGYELLRRVSHWSDEDVERERKLLAKPPVTPSVSLTKFSDLLLHFEFLSNRSGGGSNDSLKLQQ
jgi:phosphoglycolate phosphatase